MNCFDWPVLKTCSRCGETKPIEEFAINRRAGRFSLGRQAWCRECYSQYHSIRREDARQEVTA